MCIEVESVAFYDLKTQKRKFDCTDVAQKVVTSIVMLSISVESVKILLLNMYFFLRLSIIYLTS